ncbi:polyprenyl synthetase family protein [Streptomyces coeruleorubidus]|uniref:polyprenyl synthetase family protein n=1 Tax=Streptomyces coeruleorubidus TaxID=116188 RepID=UPI0033A9D7DD
MSRQDLHALFGLDRPRFLGCYDPLNRRTDEFVKEFLVLPDGTDVRQMGLPVEHMDAGRFRLHGELDLTALRREVDGPYRDVRDELAAIPLFGYNDSPFSRKHCDGWTEYLGRNVWSTGWQHHYAAALMIHFYRRITPPEYQSAAHMRLVYAVAAAAEYLTTLTIITDDWMDGARVRNGGPAWHLRHPRSFANDTLVLAVQALNVLSAVVPDRHPFKRQMYDRAVRQLANDAHYFTYHSMQDARRTQVLDGAKARFTVPVEDITLDTYHCAVLNRASHWIHFLVSMSHMLACYGPEISEGTAVLNYIEGATTATCVLDDIVDDPTGEDIRTGEPAIQLCLAVHKAKGLLGPVSAADATEILDTVGNHVGLGTGTDADLVRRVYARHGIPELALDYLEAVLDRLLPMRRAAVEECGCPGDLPAFMLRWLAIDRGGVTERAGETGDFLGQERFRHLVAQLARADEAHGRPASAPLRVGE